MMLLVYILLEIIMIILGIISKDKELILYIPTIISLLYMVLNKGNNKIKLGLFLTALAIYFFIENTTLGIALFIFVQIIYTFYLKEMINPKLVGVEIINIIMVYILKDEMMVLESFLFIMILFSNLIYSKKSYHNKLIYHSFIWLLISSIFMLVVLWIPLKENIDILMKIFGWITFNISQVILVIYVLGLDDSFLYRLISPLFTSLLRLYYHPTIINKEVIPSYGKAVIAGNHKHALDPILVNSCTKRVVHTLAKKELHDGRFGWLFRAGGTIPVDLHAAHNKEALDSAVLYLNKGCLINLSPEAKRNYTKEILLPFKFGAVVMAKRTNSKIIPYSITGDYKFRSKNLKIVFGEPIDIKDLSIEEANELLYNKVKELIIQNRK